MATENPLASCWVRLLKSFGITKYATALGSGEAGEALQAAYETACQKVIERCGASVKVPTWQQRLIKFNSSVDKTLFERELGVEKSIKADTTSIVDLITAGSVTKDLTTDAKGVTLFDDTNDGLLHRITAVLRSVATESFDMNDILDSWHWDGVTSAMFKSNLKQLPLVKLSGKASDPLSSRELLLPDAGTALKNNGFVIQYNNMNNVISTLKGQYTISAIMTANEFGESLNSMTNEKRHEQLVTALKYEPRSRSVMLGEDTNPYMDGIDTIGMLVSLGLVGMVISPRLKPDGSPRLSAKTQKPLPGLMVIAGALTIGDWLAVAEHYIGSNRKAEGSFRW